MGVGRNERRGNGMTSIPMGKFSRIFIVDQSGVIYWYSGRLIHTLGLHYYRHRPIVTKIFLSYFQSTVNGVLEPLLFNYWCPVFCGTVYLLLVCWLHFASIAWSGKNQVSCFLWRSVDMNVHYNLQVKKQYTVLSVILSPTLSNANQFS